LLLGKNEQILSILAMIACEHVWANIMTISTGCGNSKTTAIPLFQGENYILNSLGKRVTMGVNENND
jgi:hypothetical protein